MGAIFALTRIVGSVRTCSCGFPGSFDLNKMVDPEFCQIFKEEHGIKKDHDYYNVNCVTDLDDGGSTIVCIKSILSSVISAPIVVNFHGA